MLIALKVCGKSSQKKKAATPGRAGRSLSDNQLIKGAFYTVGLTRFYAVFPQGIYEACVLVEHSGHEHQPKRKQQDNRVDFTTCLEHQN
ncbi:MAG: hypothetical protein EA392_14160 [Cryomorphaceae bacterium]|nr:MAG: hypothetical protein EA392_14160 [Cryomorphaceae bacterium]